MKYFAKYLPVEGEIKEGDLYSCPHKGHALKIPGMPLAHEPKMIICEYGTNGGVTCPDCYKVKLFLCSRDIQVGDKVYSFIEGHCDDVEISPFHPKVTWDMKELTSGWPNEPHTILDLNHSEYKPYRIRTDFGFGSPGRYIKVIGEISPEATWVKEGDEFTEEQIKLSEHPECPKCGAWGNDGFCPEDIDCEIFKARTLAYILGPCSHFH